MVFWNGMSEIIDKSFEGEDWESKPLPKQHIPAEVLKLLEALDATRAPGWLSVESHIRDLGEEGRNKFARILRGIRQCMKQRPALYFLFGEERQPLFVWLQRHDKEIDWEMVNRKASASALAFKASKIIGVLAEVKLDEAYHRAQHFAVHIPTARTDENAHIYDDAVRAIQRKREVTLSHPKTVTPAGKTKTVGRNEPCPCGSGKKYKKCHGR